MDVIFYVFILVNSSFTTRSFTLSLVIAEQFFSVHLLYGAFDT